MAPEAGLGHKEWRERHDGPGERTRGEGAKEEGPVAFGAIFTFFKPFFASVNLKILFCRKAILDFW